eukprot:2798867-Pyramimonas_sp.AAC.1
MTVPTLAMPTLTVPTKLLWKATRSYRLCTLCARAPRVAEVRVEGHVAVLFVLLIRVSDVLLDPGVAANRCSIRMQEG